MKDWLCHYLPYGVAVETPGGKGEVVGVNYLGSFNVHVLKNSTDSMTSAYRFEEVKLVLRPFGDLVKDLGQWYTEGVFFLDLEAGTQRTGKRVRKKVEYIPAFEIAKLAYDFKEKYNENFVISYPKKGSDLQVLSKTTIPERTDKYQTLKFEPYAAVFFCKDWTIHVMDAPITKTPLGPFPMCQGVRTRNQIQIHEFLLRHHFDIFGLIEKGLAVAKP